MPQGTGPGLSGAVAKGQRWRHAVEQSPDPGVHSAGFQDGKCGSRRLRGQEVRRAGPALPGWSTGCWLFRTQPGRRVGSASIHRHTTGVWGALSGASAPPSALVPKLTSAPGRGPRVLPGVTLST